MDYCGKAHCYSAACLLYPAMILSSSFLGFAHEIRCKNIPFLVDIFHTFFLFTLTLSTSLLFLSASVSENPFLEFNASQILNFLFL